MPKKITTKFKEFDKLADDITPLAKKEDGSYEKVKGAVELVKVIGVVTDEDEIKKIEETLTLDIGLNIKEIKRGQTIYLTAMLQKPSTTQTWNAQTLGVISARVIDYWYGLNKLNSLQRSGKI